MNGEREGRRWEGRKYSGDGTGSRSEKEGDGVVPRREDCHHTYNGASHKSHSRTAYFNGPILLLVFCLQVPQIRE